MVRTSRKRVNQSTQSLRRVSGHQVCSTNRLSTLKRDIAARLNEDNSGMRGVVADLAGRTDRLAGLRRIGIDEICWREDEYLMAVTDHDTGRMVWAAEGRCQDTVRALFTALGPGRAKQLTHVSADGAEWIHDVIRERAPQAAICLDPFHVVKWAGDALDELRRRLANELRAAGKDDQAATLGSGMWALRKKPGSYRHPAHRPGPDRRRQQASLQGLSDERAAPCGVRGQGRARPGTAGRADLLGPAVPHPRVRKARQDTEKTQAADLEHPG